MNNRIYSQINNIEIYILVNNIIYSQINNIEIYSQRHNRVDVKKATQWSSDAILVAAINNPR